VIECKKGEIFSRVVKVFETEENKQYEPSELKLTVEKDGKEIHSYVPKKTAEGYRFLVNVDMDAGDYEFVWRGIVDEVPFENRESFQVTSEKTDETSKTHCEKCLLKNFDSETANVDADALNMTETADYLAVDAVIAREGVFPFHEGKIYRPAKVLERAALLQTEMPLILRLDLAHPPEGVVMTTKDIMGTAYVEEFKDAKIKARLTINKKVAPQSLIDAVKRGELRDVSIGYYHVFEEKEGNWNEHKYDLVETDLKLDHVAIVEKGRCSLPLCGIGVDQPQPEVGNDPFGRWKGFNDCVQWQMKHKGLPKKNAEKLCGWLQARLKPKGDECETGKCEVNEN